MDISIVIPTLNEADRIGELVQYLRECENGPNDFEIIVVDGYSTDDTELVARRAGAVTMRAQRGRAVQMNHGASRAKGDILFFLHADTTPPPSFRKDILHTIRQGYSAGCYRLSFDYNHWFLKLNCWFTRFNFTRFRFGDQGLFVTRDLFQRSGCFNNSLALLEDQDLVRRIRRMAGFKVLDRAVVTSARKYLQNGILRLQFIFLLIYVLYSMRFSQRRLTTLYRRLIRDERNAPQSRPSLEPEIPTDCSSWGA